MTKLKQKIKAFFNSFRKMNGVPRFTTRNEQNLLEKMARDAEYWKRKYKQIKVQLLEERAKK